ncbi:hypothetical protein BH09PSE4_BH09PSE4_19840 [soil metagenome]
MAYADQKMSSSKVVAIVIVALIHAALGYAFVTGLAFQYVKKVADKLDTFDVEEPPPPPPDEPPPPPPDQPLQPPPVVSPPPMVVTNTPPVVVMQTVPSPPPMVVVAPPAPPAPPHISQQAQAKGAPASWFSTDDYPPSAIRAEAQGRASVRVTIDTNGRISGCTITASTGNADLDNQTCIVAKRRGRYSPAKDENGNPISATSSFNVKWVLPEN